MPDLAEVAAELYAVSPEEFVDVRTEWVKRARADGDRELAAAVSKLPKPTTVAWLLNCLVRERPDRVRELITLGDALREAQKKLSGPQLRQLSRQRHDLIAAFTSMALGPAEDAGKPVTADLRGQVQETLGAAIADPEAGEALLSGRLTKGLSYVGLGEVEPGKAATPAKPPPKRKADKADKADAQRAKAERQQRVDAARAEYEQRGADARAAAAELSGAIEAAERAAAAVDTARVRADDLRRSLAEAEEAVREAENEAEGADVGVEAARGVADAAQEALQRAEDELREVQSQA
jgi:hypothetical protein